MHKQCMAEALQLAALGRYTVHPNPMVGCLIVKNEVVVGRGFHQKAGAAHAEIYALAEAGEQAKGATLYVTLEPCCHFGRTKPCTDALIKAQIKEIFVACIDPNPVMAGKGIACLRAAGISVHVGLLEQEAQMQNRIFFHYIQTKRPYVVAKWAMSLDGKMAVNSGDDRSLSSEASLKDLHELRQSLPGILIGAATAGLDNPALTVRLPEVSRQPQRIVVNTKGDLSPKLSLFNGSLPGKTWLVCSDKVKPHFPAETTLILPCKTRDAQIDLSALLVLLAEQELSGVLVEGGPQILHSFFTQNLVNEVVSYVTPWIIAGLPHKARLQSLALENLDGDCKIQAILKPQEP